MCEEIFLAHKDAYMYVRGDIPPTYLSASDTGVGGDIPRTYLSAHFLIKVDIMVKRRHISRTYLSASDTCVGGDLPRT